MGNVIEVTLALCWQLSFICVLVSPVCMVRAVIAIINVNYEYQLYRLFRHDIFRLGPVLIVFLCNPTEDLCILPVPLIKQCFL